LPEEDHGLSLELVGLLGFEDPVRPKVPAAVAECQAAGVRVVMITGDYARSRTTSSRGRKAWPRLAVRWSGSCATWGCVG
jgi:Ca2+-transporting ATPase